MPAHSLDPDLCTGDARIDAYLGHGFERVLGMSSRFAAAISAWLMGQQSAQGITGGVCEIGAFQGRFLIALSLALKPGERALGIDTFDWPTPATLARFEANCREHGLADGQWLAWPAAAETVTAAALRARLGDQPVRFFHIDGDHSPAALERDLELALSVLHQDGLICLDDMLHPAYPFLVTTVQAFLTQRPDWRLMAILDREDIVGAAKFLLCRKGAVARYEDALMARYPARHFVLGGDALGHHCVVLTPAPRLALVE